MPDLHQGEGGQSPCPLVQAVEMFVTFGGCPHGRARQRKHGVRPNERFRPTKAANDENDITSGVVPAMKDVSNRPT